MDVHDLAVLDNELFEANLSGELLHLEIRAGFGWLIEDDEDLKSFILVRDDGYILDITRLGTRTAYQGQGLGTRLLTHVLRTRRPVMLTVDKANAVGLRMYLKHGFKIVGHLPTVEAWVLRRNAT